VWRFQRLIGSEGMNRDFRAEVRELDSRFEKGSCPG
jgi:hypothetical protein